LALAEVTYTPSETLAGETERIREHSFTRWMSRELLQAAADFCKNIGLVPIYAECSGDESMRYLFWRPPPGALVEVRSGRAIEQFKRLDEANAEKGRTLLSLHVNERDMYSAVWVSSGHYDTATAMLAVYGITPAQRTPGA
jgi:hypothetical protein